MIANTINNFPIGLGSIINDYENMDFITPNRLWLGRNNDHSPAATLEVTGNPYRILKENRKMFNYGLKPGWYLMYQDWWIIRNGFIQIMT